MIRKLTNQAIGKEVDARLRLLYSNNFCQKILSTFGYSIFHRTSLIHSGFIEFFETLYKKRGKEHVCVEIGTWNGLTSAFLAGYFHKVITCDIADEPIKYDVWDKMGVQDRIEFIKVADERDKEKKIMARDFQFAYLDGNHRKPDTDWVIFNKCKTGLIHEAWDVAPENALRVSSHPNHRLLGFNFAYIGPDLSIDGEAIRREEILKAKKKKREREEKKV